MVFGLIGPAVSVTRMNGMTWRNGGGLVPINLIEQANPSFP